MSPTLEIVITKARVMQKRRGGGGGGGFCINIFFKFLT